MLKIFKSLGLGFLIVLTSPLWLIGLALFIILIIFKYIIGEILSLYYFFFKGSSYIEDDDYEEELIEVLDEKEKEKETKKQQQPIYVQTVPNKYIDPRFFQDNLDEEETKDE